MHVYTYISEWPLGAVLLWRQAIKAKCKYLNKYSLYFFVNMIYIGSHYQKCSAMVSLNNPVNFIQLLRINVMSPYTHQLFESIIFTGAHYHTNWKPGRRCSTPLNITRRGDLCHTHWARISMRIREFILAKFLTSPESLLILVKQNWIHYTTWMGWERIHRFSQKTLQEFQWILAKILPLELCSMIHISLHNIDGVTHYW